MKHCPKCNRTFENSLDFCLEDGTRLLFTASGTAPVTTGARPTTTAAETVAFPIAPMRSATDLSGHGEVETVVAKTEAMLPIEASGRNQIFEYASIVVALAHNWWQWLYLEKQYVSSIMEYILSANFLMWLLLLGAGTALGLFTVRKSPRKVFGVLSLVILAINLILFLVPRR